MKLPRPETLRAKLVSTGITRPTWTPHVYVDTRPCVIDGPGGGDAYEFIFRCEETGMERRWGTRYIEEIN